MRVVLDTNIFCADYRLKGNAFRVLFDVATRVGIEILVPQIVLEEIVGKYQSVLRDSISKLEKATKDTGRLLGTYLPLTPAISELENVVQEYHAYLSSTFEKYNVQILPYPNISHGVIVKRAIEHRKPFKENGDGYRDTLIWYSLLEEAKKKSGPIILVTSNHKDFGKGALLSDLQSDLEELELPEDCIQVTTTLEEFNSHFIYPKLSHLDEMIEKLENELIKDFSLRDWIQKSLVDELEWAELGDIFAGIEQGHADIRIAHISRVDRITVDDVRLLPSGDFLISVTANVAAELGISANWRQYQEYDDVREWFKGDHEDEPFEWATAYPTENADVSFTIILQEGTHSVLSSTVNRVDSNYYSVELNPHPRKGT